MFGIIATLVGTIIAEAPKYIAAGIDVADLLGAGRSALERVKERSPDFATNEQFVALNKQLDDLEGELQRNAAARG